MSRHSRWRRGFGAFAGPVAALARCRLLRSLIGRAATVRSDLKKALQLDDSTQLLSDCDRRPVRGAGPFHGHRPDAAPPVPGGTPRSEEHTSELQSLMRISYAVFCLKKKTN